MVKINIKDVGNGWLVHYDIMEHTGEGFDGYNTERATGLFRGILENNPGLV